MTWTVDQVPVRGWRHGARQGSHTGGPRQAWPACAGSCTHKPLGRRDGSHATSSSATQVASRGAPCDLSEARRGPGGVVQRGPNRRPRHHRADDREPGRPASGARLIERGSRPARCDAGGTCADRGRPRERARVARAETGTASQRLKGPGRVAAGLRSGAQMPYAALVPVHNVSPVAALPSSTIQLQQRRRRDRRPSRQDST